MARRVTSTRALVAVLAIAVVVVSACSTSSAPKAAAGLQARKATIGGLEVTVTPTELDSRGAAFTVVFDTHTGAPGIDVAANAALAVDGTAWTAPTWSGDGSGGHHRTGILRFTNAGPARGAAQLTITGLDQPLAMTWQLTQ